MKTFIFLFFLRPFVHPQKIMNEKDKVIRNTYISNSTKQWLEECIAKLLKKCSGLLHRCSGRCPHPQGCDSLHGHITLRMKAVCSFETSASSYPTTRCNNPEVCFSTKTGLELTKSFSALLCMIITLGSSLKGTQISAVREL